MPSRKRRSNRLTIEQLEANSELRETQLNQAAMLIGYGQEHVDWMQALYRTVSLRLALQMVREGDAVKEEVDSANGPVVIFRELKPIAGAQYQLPMLPNAAAAELLAGYEPNSRIGGKALQRIQNVLMFPFEGDPKNPLTGPRVSDHDRDRARRLVGMRPATAGHCYRDTRVLRNELAAAA